MKRPSCYISILLRFTKRNQEKAYQPVGDTETKKRWGICLHRSWCFCKICPCPGGDGRRNIKFFCWDEYREHEVPQGLRHPTLPESGVLVPLKRLVPRHPCCIPGTLLLQLGEVKILVTNPVTSWLFLNFSSECQLFGVHIFIIGRILVMIDVLLFIYLFIYYQISQNQPVWHECVQNWIPKNYPSFTACLYFGSCFISIW